jgi:hypothetical protein
LTTATREAQAGVSRRVAGPGQVWAGGFEKCEGVTRRRLSVPQNSCSASIDALVQLAVGVGKKAGLRTEALTLYFWQAVQSSACEMQQRLPVCTAPAWEVKVPARQETPR